MSVLEQLQERVKAALKAGRKEEVAATRYLVAMLQREAKDSGASLDAQAELAVLHREKKRRLEAAAAFRVGGRDDLAAKESREVALIDEFLPAQLDDDALGALVDELIVEIGASGPRDMGKVMGLLMNRVGAQVDGKVASRMVKERLSS
ncbi:MAG: GatB/YqeY domain-containing protein [Thermoleophilia bacterium]|nr:GatB/YqeY domain-containing protein [Thermoleophilia bacterium]